MVSGCIVDICGLPVSLQAEDILRGKLLATVTVPASNQRPARIAITFSRQAPSRPTGPPQESYEQLDVWRKGEVLKLSHRNYGTVATNSAIRIGGEGDNMGGAFSYFLPFALTHTLALHDRMILHGGCIRLAPTQAILILGKSGSGKSTAVAGALNAGWEATSDDLVGLRKIDERIMASGISKPLAIPADIATSSGRTGKLIPGDVRHRFVVDNHSWAQGSYRLVGCVVVAHGTSDETELFRIKGWELFEHIVGAFASATDPALVKRLWPLIVDSCRLPAWELRHASDPSARLSGAAECFATIGLALKNA